MPVVLRSGGFTVRIRTHDHSPPHVHVFHSGEEVVINLGDHIEPPWIRDLRGMSLRRMRQALALVMLNQERLQMEWTRIHG
jgi:hypothetical protein